MNKAASISLRCLILLSTMLSAAAPSRGDQPANETPAAAPPGNAISNRPGDEKPVVTHHQIVVAGKTYAYTATAAQMPISDASGDTEAHIFYMAYTLDGAADRSKRPLTFAFNGGPGSASIWLHMGALGPRRPQLLENGDMPAPPFHLADNEDTWLLQTDLVFIDPVGTGFSRAKSAEAAKRFYGMRGDIQSFSEFIRMYLTRAERWGSPLFLVGESYGTFRAAGLAGALVDNGIALNGIVLVSTVLDFSLLDEGNAVSGLPFAVHLPTMTADAWYHKRLAPELQKDLRATLKESEQWAMNGYLAALNQGDRLPPVERKAAVEKLARYTGLEPREIDEANLRIGADQFSRQLLRDKKQLLGLYDGRLTGPLGPGVEPSLSRVRPPFESAFQQYLRGELDYKTDLFYNVLGLDTEWHFGNDNHYAETASALRGAMAKNPHMQVLMCAGYYDIVTPYLGADYMLSHLGLPPEMQNRIHLSYYEAGHMMYIDRKCREKMRRDAAEFIDRAMP